jgi:hypothetical protein
LRCAEGVFVITDAYATTFAAPCRFLDAFLVCRWLCSPDRAPRRPSTWRRRYRALYDVAGGDEGTPRLSFDQRYSRLAPAITQTRPG